MKMCYSLHNFINISLVLFSILLCRYINNSICLTLFHFNILPIIILVINFNELVTNLESSTISYIASLEGSTVDLKTNNIIIDNN